MRLSARPAAAMLAAAALAGCNGGPGDGEAEPATSPPPDFVGMVSDDVAVAHQDYRLETLAAERRAGVRLIRQSFDWAQLEPRPGEYRMRYYDHLMAALARNRLRLLPVLSNPPLYRQARPRRGAVRGIYPPRRPADMAALAERLVERYGPSGQFWQEHPDLPHEPIRSWQIWNEPSLPVYWAPRPDAAAYTRLLQTVAVAIKKVDPEAEIVSAGIPESRLGVPFAEYLNALYDVGASASFDTLAIHPYAEDVEATVAALRRAREIVSARGGRRHIWITELGWASGGPPSPFTVTEEGQARRIGGALRELGRLREELGIRGVVVYNWKDVEPYEGARDFFGYHTGLHESDGTPKPAFKAFQEAVRALSE